MFLWENFKLPTAVTSLCLASEGSLLPKSFSYSAYQEVRVYSWKLDLWSHWTFSCNGCIYIIDWGLFHTAFFFLPLATFLPLHHLLMQLLTQDKVSYVSLTFLIFWIFFSDNLLHFKIMNLNSWIEHFSKHLFFEACILNFKNNKSVNNHLSAAKHQEDQECTQSTWPG